MVKKKLVDYHAIKDTNSEIDELITLAGNFADEFDISEKTEVDIDSTTKKAIGELAKLLSNEEEIDDLQNAIYQIAKRNQIEPKDFFRTLYQIILSTTKGPKIGPFITDIGRKKISDKLSEYI